MSELKCRYEVTGAGICYLVEWLHGKNVSVYDVKYIENGVILTIAFKDRKKLFAISDNMCYNIKKIGYEGRFALVKRLSERVGLLIGAVAFLAAAIITDPIVTDFVYLGDAVYMRREIRTVLSEEGVDIGKRLNSETLGELGRKMTSSSDIFSFVSVRRKGHRLLIEAYRAEPEILPLDVKRDKIISPVSGKILRLVVLSGTPRVSEGDNVEEGAVLIDAEFSHNEKTGETYALGEAEIICELIYVYEGTGDDAIVKSRATVLALGELEGREILTVNAVITETDGKKLCTVRIEYIVWVG